MPTDLEQLRTIKSQALAQLVELRANPKPSYQIDGQQVAWTEYLRQLQLTVDWCDNKLAAAEPFEYTTRGRT